MAEIQAGDDGESLVASMACVRGSIHDPTSDILLNVKARHIRKGSPIRIRLEHQEALQLSVDLAAALAGYEPVEPVSGGQPLG